MYHTVWRTLARWIGISSEVSEPPSSTKPSEDGMLRYALFLGVIMPVGKDVKGITTSRSCLYVVPAREHTFQRNVGQSTCYIDTTSRLPTTRYS
jgi:hypothetical protein